MTEARKYCELVALMQRQNLAAAGTKLIGPCEFLIKHGEDMTVRLPSKTRGLPKNCYNNAYRLALKSKGRLRYVEGYATGLIPVAHAWCVDEYWRVIDPTWDSVADIPATQADYFGVLFPDLALVRRLRKLSDSLSIFDAWFHWETLLPVLTKAFPLVQKLD